MRTYYWILLCSKDIPLFVRKYYNIIVIGSSDRINLMEFYEFTRTAQSYAK